MSHVSQAVAPEIRNSVEEEGTEFKDSDILAKGLSLTLIGGLSARAIGMVSQVLMARFLGAADFGLYAIGWTLVRVSEPLLTLGLDTGVMYFGADYIRLSAPKFKGVVKQSLMLSFCSGATLGAILYLVAPALARDVFRKPEASTVIRAFIPAFPLYGVFLVAGGVARLSQRMQYYVYSNIGFTASALVFFCVLFLLGSAVEGAVAATAAGIGVGTVMALYFIVRLFPKIVASSTRSESPGGQLLGYSVPVGLASLAYLLLAYVDRLFVGSFCTSAQTGMYQAAGQVLIFFLIIFGAFQNIFSPMASNLHACGERGRLAELYCVCTKWGFWVGAPLFLVVLFASGPLIEILYGRVYAQAAIPLVILSAGQLFMVTTGTSMATLLMTGRQKLAFIIGLGVLIVDLPLSYILVPAFGLCGAASAASISLAALNVIAMICVRITLGIWPFDRHCLNSVLAFVITAGVLWLLRSFGMATAAIVTLMEVAGISVSVFFGALIALGLDSKDRELFNRAWGRLLRIPTG